MVLLKTSLLFSFLAISCLAVDNQTNITTKVDVIPISETKIAPVEDSIKNGTTPVPPTTVNPNVTSTTLSPSPNTTTSTTTTTPTTIKPSTSTIPPSPNTTTLKPTTSTLKPSSTTTSPNVTTVGPTPPEPTPIPARSWDGPSFFGGVVLAFDIVEVGFVGY
uniref:Uncharacterized protein n=1 Tax=Sipha flava TaxID=143950 RepID=A0A2S2QLY6_9HEMI